VIVPYLAPKHSWPSVSGKSHNPLVELPCTPEAVIAATELVLISHLHSDHAVDSAAQALLPKAQPISCPPVMQTRAAPWAFSNSRLSKHGSLARHRD
jgi:L-ascorbate metabolism protein UlaG (beta-lactamase superfamily)